MFLDEAFSQEFVNECVGLLVSRFIPLEKADLEMWLNHPEEWVNDEERGSNAWEFDLRVYWALDYLIILHAHVILSSHAQSGFLPQYRYSTLNM